MDVLSASDFELSESCSIPSGSLRIPYEDVLSSNITIIIHLHMIYRSNVAGHLICLISLKTYLCNGLTTDGLTSCWLILVLEGLRYEDDMYPWFDDTEYPPGDVTLWLRGEWLYLEEAYNGEAAFCLILPILGLPCWAFSWSSFSFACNGIEMFFYYSKYLKQ